jgi:hypothetical protein
MTLLAVCSAHMGRLRTITPVAVSDFFSFLRNADHREGLRLAAGEVR